MPRWDYTCPECGSIREMQFATYTAAEHATVLCPVCQQDVDQDVPMTRLTPAVGFTIHGYNAKTGYKYNTPRSAFEKGEV